MCDYCTNNSESRWYNDGKDVTHQVCVDFPDHPWLHVVRKGLCNYQFKKVNNQSMDDLPFVDGKFIKDGV